MSECELFVGFIPFEVDEEELRLFLNFHSSNTGHTLNVLIKRQINTGRSRGFAFVKMSCREAANKIVESKPLRLKGNVLDIRFNRLPRTENITDSFGQKKKPSYSPRDATCAEMAVVAGLPDGELLESFVGLGVVSDDGCITPEFRSSMVVHLNANDKPAGEFCRGDRVYMEWKWLRDEVRYVASFVTKVHVGWATVSALKNAYGFLDSDGCPSGYTGRIGVRRAIFFPYNLAEHALNCSFPSKIEKVLKLGDAMQCVYWDQRLRKPGTTSMLAERLVIPPMVVWRRGKLSRFDRSVLCALIELSWDKRQGILFCVPLCKVLIEDMGAVSNRSNVGWQYGDRILFDARKNKDSSNFGCGYVALNAVLDNLVRISYNDDCEIEEELEYSLNEDETTIQLDNNPADHLKPEISMPNFTDGRRVPNQIEEEDLLQPLSSKHLRVNSHSPSVTMTKPVFGSKTLAENTTVKPKASTWVSNTEPIGQLAHLAISNEYRPPLNSRPEFAADGRNDRNDLIQRQRVQRENEFLEAVLGDQEILRLVICKHPQMLTQLIEGGSSSHK